MTYIEFFEKDAAENICSSLTRQPERIILIGDRAKLMKAHAKRYAKVFAGRGLNIEILWRTINKNSIDTILTELSRIIETYPDCVFDLTGGEDLYLVAMGIVCERYRDRNIQMHRFNIRNNTIVDCDADGATVFEGQLPPITVEENVRIYGGDVVYEDVKPETTVRWDMSDEFREDIRRMWKVCSADVRDWNGQIGVFVAAEAVGGTPADPLLIMASVPAVRSYLQSHDASYVYHPKILRGLREAGLITSYSIDEDYLTVSFKNLQVRRCLTKAGQALEMRVYLAALEAAEADGTKTYHDACNGVFIDWDGKIHTDGSADTENEIDIIMTHGMVPVFVSCKNGVILREELYKLAAVADRFGGKYARKVLIATSLGNNDFSTHLRLRAADMGIRLVEDLQHMSDSEITRVIRSLWCN